MKSAISLIRFCFVVVDDIQSSLARSGVSAKESRLGFTDPTFTCSQTWCYSQSSNQYLLTIGIIKDLCNVSSFTIDNVFYWPTFLANGNCSIQPFHHHQLQQYLDWHSFLLTSQLSACSSNQTCNICIFQKECTSWYPLKPTKLHFWLSEPPDLI